GGKTPILEQLVRGRSALAYTEIFATLAAKFDTGLDVTCRRLEPLIGNHARQPAIVHVSEGEVAVSRPGSAQQLRRKRAQLPVDAHRDDAKRLSLRVAALRE